MIFVTGPLYAGKREYIRNALGLSEAAFSARAVWDVQELARGATELGGGLVPIERAEREKREAAGRLACLLAERANTVVRVCCGLGQVLKGELP